MEQKNKTEQKTIECKQKECAFNMGLEGCKNCNECGAPPNEVNENCNRCFDCEYKEGSCRWKDDTTKEKEKDEVEVPEEVKKMIMEEAMAKLEKIKEDMKKNKQEQEVRHSCYG